MGELGPAAWLKSPAEIQRMAAAGRLIASTFERLQPLILPGITTAGIDAHVAACIAAAGGEPIFLGYRGFPGHCCVSVNEEIVHGVPGARSLNRGDIVTVDVGVRLAGYCADAACTFLVAPVSESGQLLVACCEEALAAGIEQAQPGAPLVAVSRAIQRTVEGAGFQVVTEYVGHGIGREMHEEPPVPNHVDSGWDLDVVLEPGMVLAIEPMITAGSPRVETRRDGWTVVTCDRGLAAHCEHTVAVTTSGPEVLTALVRGS